MRTSAHSRSRTAGFTLLEVLMVAALAALFVSMGVAMVRSASDVATQDTSRAQLLNAHRRNLEFVTNTLRGADLATLAGFDTATDLATTPRFQRVAGAKEGLRTHVGEEFLEWRASPRPVGGVAAPGAVWLVGPTGATIAADRVPRGGFVVRREGRNLSVRLTTYHPQPGTNALHVSSTTTVSVRN